MSKSPTVHQALKHFSMLSNKINNISEPNRLYIWMCIYPSVILFLLLFIKPSFIVEIDYTSNEKTISIRKLIVWMIIFHAVPIMAYYIS